MMLKSVLLVSTALAGLISTNAVAQTPTPPAKKQAVEQVPVDSGEIVVTAQRQSERLQDVPVAVSAFNSEMMKAQQINSASDLQATLPNVQFTKTNFTSSSFTIRGIGDLCVGVTCDAATATHLNDEPLFDSRVFETEYSDIERVEVLRGPQGTLFGRNATAGVVNLITAKPNLTKFGASGEFEYGNYDSKKAKAMINLPIADTLGVRFAGYYLNRDGYTKNLHDGSRIDDRNLYSVRGSLRWEPSETTTFDLMGSYFREKDNRTRIQKQMCQRDPTGTLGCLPNAVAFEQSNSNSTFTSVLTSHEFFAIRGIPTVFALGSLYGTAPDTLTPVPANFREVDYDFVPQYRSSEIQVQGKLKQELGAMNLSLSGTYQKASVDSQQDYLMGVFNRAPYQTALNTLYAAGHGLVPGLPQAYFAPISQALIPQGPTGPICTSLAEPTGTGAYGGHSLCAQTPIDFDRSGQKSRAYSAEAIVSSDFDGRFNFLLGGIYANFHMKENSYYVNTFAIDYLSGMLGTFTALGGGLPPAYLATPYYRSNTSDYRLKSVGLFGEAYFDVSDKLKVTFGARYNNDRKFVQARNTLVSFLAPFNSTEAFASPYAGTFDADPGIAGNQPFQERRVKFNELTGRAVADYKISPNNMVYASYSRGYKSGGINPPLAPVFAVSDTFNPEFINAFEIGSKNTFDNGRLMLNLTGFYYKYKDLQLARIVARTAVNDNVDANIYGVEAEAVIKPIPAFQVNLGASLLHTKVSSDKLLANPRDPSGGRADAVIIKDITNGANCAVTSDIGNAAAVQAFVTAVNAGMGLRGPTAYPTGSGLAATGAFGICSVYSANASGAAALGGVTVHPSGVLENIKGNVLPQAPKYKFSAGAQYVIDLGGEMELIPRVDLAFTGNFYSNIFNMNADRLPGYELVNAQLTFNGPQQRYYARAFVQNLTNSNARTGQYVGDASSGLYTNVFTLEPRRYGVAVGFKF